MIEPVETVYAIGYISGMFSMVIAGAVAVVINSKGKRPKYIESRDKYDEGYWECPDCGNAVGYYDIREHYCSECGTKIDWSENNGKSIL